jgi:lysophospholipase L1-like esterase
VALASTGVVPASSAQAHDGGGGHRHRGDREVVVSLGDSVAAGYGGATVDKTANAAPCGRTTSAYGYQVAARTGRTVKVLACSGATAAVGLLAAQGSVPAQLDQVAVGTPVVILTIGANDVHQGDLLAACLSPTNDCATAVNTTAFNAALAQTQPLIAKALSALIDQKHVGRVVLTGYYDPFGRMAGKLGLQRDEIAWYRERIADLNGMLRLQTRHMPQVTFVSLRSLDAAVGDIQLDSKKAGVLHPTAQGQHKIAELVAAAL